LFVKTRDGKAHRLTSFARGKQGALSIAGETLFYETGSTTTSTTAVVWNLRTRHSKTFVVTNARAAAPDGGWTFVDAEAAAPHALTLFERTARGRNIRLGSPDPDGSSYSLAVGDHYLVAYSGEEGNGSVTVLNFNKPGELTVLIPAGGSVVSSSCAGVTAKYTACLVARLPHAAMRLYKLSGEKVAGTSHGCVVGQPAVAGDAVAWVTQADGSCSANELWLLARSGRRLHVPGRYALDSDISALSGVVVSTKSHHDLYLVTSSGRRHRIADTAD
jgi:hypothetical protein